MTRTTRRYLVIGAGLLGLQLCAMGVAVLGLGWLGSCLILGCAAFQAAIVSFELMELHTMSGIVRLFAYGVIFWLCVMFVLTLADLVTR